MSPRLALHLLGPPKLEVDNASVAVDRRKTLALLAYLMVNPGRQSRDYLSGLLWPDYDQSKAFTNLRHTLWEIQQTIGEGWISADRETIGWVPEADSAAGRVFWLDVDRFRSLINEGRTQSSSSSRIPLLTESISLYRNHLLTGFSLKDAPTFNEWAFAESEGLRQQLAGALTLLTTELCSADQAEAAIPHAQRLIAIDPLNEASHRQLMQIYLQVGHYPAALKQYQTCEKILRKELGVDPQAETRALYKQIRKGEFKSSQPAKPKETLAPQHNLPYQLSTFIGREKELLEVENLIGNHRLVTLTGTGGIGKTRLALKMGEHLLKEYANGIWLVELAALNDAARVPQTVGALFNLVEGSDEVLIEKLIQVLRPKSLLLILDNCEHLLEASAQLADSLLKNCPTLKILATSREALGITGEAQYQVPPLGLPKLQQLLERLLNYESIQLFAERARLVQDHFDLTTENVIAVARICQRLDGIPLAIELAAARVNLLSTTQIADRLDQSFNLLTGGSRTTLPRHQTLRASIHWSWNLLSEPEKILLRRLSIFTGGWTLAGAEVVGEGGGVDGVEVFDLLNNLIEKSLVLFDSESVRYRILETVREFAFECLKEAGEEADIRNRHLDFCVTVAEQAESELLGKAQGLWMKKLSDEQENMLATNDWGSHSKSRSEQRFRLLGGIRYYWTYAGLAKLGFEVYSQALAEVPADIPTLAQGLTYDGAAVYAYMLRNLAHLDYAEKSIAIFEAYNDKVRLAMALTRKALWQSSAGNHARAIEIYLEAIAIGRQTNDKRPISSALNNMAELYRLNEEYGKAIPLYEEALAIDREREDLTGIVLGLVNMSRNALMQGKLQNVRPHLAEAARIADETHLREYMQFIFEGTAVLQFTLGQHRQGVRLFGAAATELGKKGYQMDRADEKFVEYWTDKMRAALGVTLFSTLMAEGGKLSYEDATAEIRKWLEEGLD